MTHSIYIYLYIFIYLRSGGREPSGYPHGFALLVQAGTSPGWGPAAVGADRPCTPPCARAFGGARSQVPITFSAGAFGQSGNTRPPGDAPVLFSYIPRVLCPLQGGVIRPTPTGDQCVGPARALVQHTRLRTLVFLAPRHGGEGPPARAPTSPASCDSSSATSSHDHHQGSSE